jgi:hypothetical protein
MDLLRFDANGHQARREGRQLGLHLRHGLLHFDQDLLAAFLGLGRPSARGSAAHRFHRRGTVRPGSSTSGASRK